MAIGRQIVGRRVASAAEALAIGSVETETKAGSALRERSDRCEDSLRIGRHNLKCTAPGKGGFSEKARSAEHRIAKRYGARMIKNSVCMCDPAWAPGSATVAPGRQRRLVWLAGPGFSSRHDSESRAASRDEEEAECCLGGKADLESDRAQARDRGAGRA